MRPEIVRWIGTALSVIAAGGLLIVSIASAPEALRGLGAVASLLSIPGFALSTFSQLRYGKNRVAMVGLLLGLFTMLHVPTIALSYVQWLKQVPR